MIYALISFESKAELPGRVKTAAKAVMDMYAPYAWFIDFDGTTDELTDLIWPDDGELPGPVPSIYCIGPSNDGSVFRNGHQIYLVDFAIDHEQASPCSFCRFVPANTVQGHAGAGSVQVAAERN